MQYMLALTLDDYIVSEYKHEKQLDWLSGIKKNLIVMTNSYDQNWVLGPIWILKTD